MKLVGLLSGGKDSCFNLLHCLANGHEIVALARLAPPSGQDELDSFMYQTVGHEALALLAECMNLPLFTETICGKSVARDRDYIPTAADEVEDLVRLLESVKTMKHAQAAIPDLQGVASGAILSDYQRTRIEHVCGRLGLTAVGYLWQADQDALVTELLANQVEPILVKVAAVGLDPHKHLGRSLGQLQPLLRRLHAQFDVHVAGEGGEYETLVVDCPLFLTHRIHVWIRRAKSQVVLASADSVAPVGYLQLQQLDRVPKAADISLLRPEHLEPRDGGTRGLRLTAEALTGACALSSLRRTLDDLLAAYEVAVNAGIKTVREATQALPPAAPAPDTTSTSLPPSVHVARQGPWTTLVNVTPRVGIDAPTFEQARSLLDELVALLARAEGDPTPANLVYVLVMVHTMDDYAEFNRAYGAVFGLNPPTRVAVGVASGGNKFVVHAVAYQPQGAADDRVTLHVQSISNWAPANIAPYSQAIAAGSAVFVAGQIPLLPASMQLATAALGPVVTASDAARTTWPLTMRHVWTVLARMCTTPDQLLLGTVYLTGPNSGAATILAYTTWLRAVWAAQMQDLGGNPDKVPPPLVVLASVDGLPRGADVEVAWLAARRSGAPATAATDDDDDDDSRLRLSPIADTRELRPGVTAQVLARAGSRLWAAVAQYEAATSVSLAAVKADMEAVAPTAPVQATLWLTPSVVLESECAPISVVRVGSLGPDVALMWSAWGERG